ncbi:hypothetical protein EZS27_031228, partial [termite gut metagenome]
MMKRINYIVNGITTVATVFMFVQCSGKSDNKLASVNSEGILTATDLKIAYVEIDSLLIQ